MAEPALAHLRSLLLITGLSGAGKTSVMSVLADNGFYCIDNLPVALLDQFLTFSQNRIHRFSRIAILLDIDSEDGRKEVMNFLDQLKPRPANVQLLFVDASNASIISRYSETRRPHPSFDARIDKSLEDTIVRERSLLQQLKEAANIVFDTSSWNIHTLRREVRENLASLFEVGALLMRVNFLSFGYKHGLPSDCDLIMDVRFLRNPYFIDGLREKDGLSMEVSEYVLETPDATEFLERFVTLLDFLLPRYALEGKAYVNIGIGCTGGKHRSVVIAEALALRLKTQPFHVSSKHRDVAK